VHAIRALTLKGSPKLHPANNLRHRLEKFPAGPSPVAHPVLYIASVEVWDAQPGDTNADGCIGRGQSGKRPADEQMSFDFSTFRAAEGDPHFLPA
jgi:hypothetical protein